MKIYIAASGNKGYYRLSLEKGFGYMHSAFHWKTPYKGLIWALDNGAYSAWVRGFPFPEKKFLQCLEEKIPQDNPPNFIICPDIVAMGKESLSFSVLWRKRLPNDYNYYLSVQDGMEKGDVLPHITEFDGIFVGGTMKWKLRTAAKWCFLAHENGLPCHIARIGTFKRLVFARSVSADSIDSSTFVQGRNRFGRIERSERQEILSKFVG